MPAQARRQPIQPQPVAVADLVGSGLQVIAAAPARALPSGEPLRNAQYFDVTRRAEGIDISALTRLPTRMADQVPILTRENLPDDAFETAADCALLIDDERVISVSGPNGTTAYPLRLFRNFMAVYGTDGDVPFCLTWNRLSQCARGFVASLNGEDLTWRDAGLDYGGNPVLYDEQTGSLWDSLTGLAITGPSAGEKALQMATSIWPWEAWRDAHQDGRVLVATLGEGAASLTEAANEELRLGQYLHAPSLPMVPEHFKADESPLPAKDFVLGVSAGGASKAYPLGPLAEAMEESVADTVGGVPIRIVVTSARTAHLADPQEGTTADIMLWFAWKESHPDTALYAVAGPEADEAGTAEAGTAEAEPGAAEE
jgi:hypothetical protein